MHPADEDDKPIFEGRFNIGAVSLHLPMILAKARDDKTLGMLHINPGAAGIYGFHKVRTMVRFVVDNGVFKDLEVIELAG